MTATMDEKPAELWLRFVSLCARIHDNYKLQEKYEKCEEIVRAHPFLSLTAVVTVLMCSAPVIFFTGFVLTSIVVTLVGFLFVEGTVLAVGVVILVMILGVVAVLGIMLSVVLISAWLGVGVALRALDFTREKWIDSSNMTLNGFATREKYYYIDKEDGKEN